MQRIKFLMFLLILISFVGGCGWRTVAVVNGEKISRKEWNERLKRIYGEMVLERMIEEKLLMQLNRKYKIQIDKTELENKYKEIVSQFQSEKAYKEMLKESKMTENEVKEQLKMGLLLEKISERDKISTSDMKKYYEKNKNRFNIPESIKVRHILTKSHEDSEKALEALKDGMNFIDAAKKFSIDEETKYKGGDIGLLRRGSVPNMPKDLEKDLFNLSVGQYSRPIQTNLGWHIFYVEKKIEEKERTFKEAKKEIEKFVSQPAGWIEVAKARAKIKIMIE